MSSFTARSRPISTWSACRPASSPPGQAAPAAHRATRVGAPCGARDSQGTADHPRLRAGYRAHDGAQDAAEPTALSTRNAMLTVNRRHSIHKQFQATRDRQICRAWRVERHDKTGRQHRSARWVLAITGLRKPTCTGRMIKKCSLAVIGKVSAPASRIQDNVSRTSALSSGELNQAPPMRSKCIL